MNKQIVSRFYLITLDDTPVYIGFTNRDIATRFREHKHDKDLPDNAIVKEIDKLVYDFTWDVATVNNNAKEVSDREAELIKEYNTQDSIYQKAIGGGQVWSEIKHFVIINREDPFWQSMPEDIILATIDKIKAKKTRLANVINHTRTTSHLDSVIKDTTTTRRLEDVINHTKTTQRLESVINNTKITQRLESVISETKTTRRLEDVINHTRTTKHIEDVINHTKTTRRLESVVNNTKTTNRLEGVISGTKTTKRLESVINHTRTTTRLENVINHTR